MIFLNHALNKPQAALSCIVAILLLSYPLQLSANEAPASPPPPSQAHGEAPAKAPGNSHGDSPGDAHAAPAHEAESHSPSEGGGAMQKDGSSKKVPYSLKKCKLFCPRHIESPDVSFAATPSAENWNYKKFRYSMVIVLASWNTRCTELALILRKHVLEFKRRHIGLLGIASHDSGEEVAKWLKEYRAGFPIAFASYNFIKEEGNPPLPTIWISDNKGFLLKRIELPTNNDVLEIIKNLYQWTDF